MALGLAKLKKSIEWEITIFNLLSLPNFFYRLYEAQLSPTIKEGENNKILEKFPNSIFN